MVDRHLTLDIRRRPAFGLVLAALLSLAALQVMELGHHHPVDDNAAHCLVCKADGGHATLAAPAPAFAGARIARDPVRQIRLAVLFHHPLPPSRGPPSYG
jgi:hypothetical protein